MINLISSNGALLKNLPHVQEKGCLRVFTRETIFVHFDTYKFGKYKFLGSFDTDFFNEIERSGKNGSNELYCLPPNNDIPGLHLSFDIDTSNLTYFHYFNFFCRVSDTSIFHICQYDLEKKNSEFKEMMTLFFKTKLLLNPNTEDIFQKLIFIYYTDTKNLHPDHLDKAACNSLLEKELSSIWGECITWFGYDDPYESRHLFGRLTFKMFHVENEAEKTIAQAKIYPWIVAFLKEDYKSNHKNVLFECNSDGKLFIPTNIMESWKQSKKVYYILENNKSSDILNSLNPVYTSELLFNNLWKFACNIIRKWNKSVNRGRVIDNFGKKVSNFLNELLSEFDKYLPENYRDEKLFVEKIQKLSDMLKQRVTSIFTKQILILQTQALDKYKDSLLKSISNTEKDYEMEKKLISENIDNWFNTSAQKIEVSEIGLTSEGAREELRSVMIEFSEKFKGSPAVKLQAMQKLEKQTTNTGLKQSGVVIGFGLTAAMRPRGYGNLQFVSSYSHGPHVLNFSLVNDRDVAEQEGQVKVKPIRIQPSLNFDIDL
jgi:hypothetical protein